MLNITIFFLLLLIVVIGFILFLRPKIASLVLILICIFCFGYFSRWFGFTRYLARLPYFLVILLAMRLVIDFLQKKINFTSKAIIKISFYFFIFLFFLTFISLLYNGENFILGLYELRYYLLLIILFLCIYFYKPIPCTLETYIKILIFVGLIQIPFTIIEYLSVKLSGLNYLSSALDRSSGTFSSYEALIFFQCIVIAISLVYQLRIRKPILKINNYILAIILTIPLIFSYSRSATAFVIVLIGIITLRQLFIQKNFKLSNIFIITFITSVIFLSFYFFFWKQHSFENQLNIEYVEDYVFRTPKDYLPYEKGEYSSIMGRARAVFESFNIVSKSWEKVLIGTSSGSFSEASLLKISGSNFFRYGQLAGIGRTQISVIIGEFGFFGFMIFLIFLVLIYKQIKTINNKNKYLLMDVYFIILINLVINSFYSRIFQFSSILFILGYFMAVSQRYLVNREL